MRLIDANELYGIEKLLDTDIVRQDKVAHNLLEQVLYDIQHVPTLTQPNEWISVEERLPNVDTHPENNFEDVCVIAVCSGFPRPMIYERALIRGKTVRRWKWMWETIYDSNDITHWMPLPEPPKEG